MAVPGRDEQVAAVVAVVVDLDAVRRAEGRSGCRRCIGRDSSCAVPGDRGGWPFVSVYKAVTARGHPFDEVGVYLSYI